MPYRILSLDGGGIRGLITAVWLQQLEQLLPQPLRRYFDLIAGTSTGALLACGVAAEIPTARIIQLYKQNGQTVFPRTAQRLWSRLTRVFSDGLDAPCYDGAGLEQALRGVFQNATLGSLKGQVMVMTYNVLDRTPLVFKNDRPEYNELRVWEVCKASASAPSYFPAHVMEVRGAKLPLIDGGVVANNPAACAIAEGARRNSVLRQANDPLASLIGDFVVASFGTGESTRPITAEQAQTWGGIEWALPVIDVLFDGSADSVDYIADQILEPANYFRFQTPLDRAYDDIDNADQTNLDALERLATAYVTSAAETARITRLAQLLSVRVNP